MKNWISPMLSWKELVWKAYVKDYEIWFFSGSRIPGIGIWKFRKSLYWKIPKIPKFRGLLTIEIFRAFLIIPGIFGKSPGFGIFFLSHGIFIPEIRDFFIPGIRNFWVSGFLSPRFGFFKSRNFYPRDLGFFLISGFLSPEFSRNSWDSCKIPGVRDFLGIF